MSIGIELKEVIETQIDWDQLISDITERFNIDIDIDELIDFCIDNEAKYVKIVEEVEYEKYHINNEGKLDYIEEIDDTGLSSNEPNTKVKK